MLKIKTLASRIWIPVAAAVIITGSSSAMVYALNSNVPQSALANVNFSTEATKGSDHTQAAAKTEVTADYTVVDLSKAGPDAEQEKLIKYKLSVIEKFSPQKTEEKYKEILANMIPGEKDMSAEQAAAYAADVLKKAYEVNLAGYTAQASFSRNPIPNTDNWGVFFHAPKETGNAKVYYVSIDSVKGTMFNAGCYSNNYAEEDSKNPKDPQWKDKAVQDIAKLIPSGVSITSSKVLFASEEAGVSVVCELSDGTACAVRVAGENKEAVAFQYFPNGYDGSWDYHPVTANGVG